MKTNINRNNWIVRCDTKEIYDEVMKLSHPLNTGLQYRNGSYLGVLDNLSFYASSEKNLSWEEIPYITTIDKVRELYKDYEQNKMIDINKKYKTRSGLDVKIYTVNGLNEEYPVIGETIDKDGSMLRTWTREGKVVNRRDLFYEFDLIEATVEATQATTHNDGEIEILTRFDKDKNTLNISIKYDTNRPS